MTNWYLAPAWAGISGSRTPAWKMDGSRTSNPYDGSRTAYGGAGSRTPAWNAGARTPYDSGSGSSGFDAFAAGSRTPAWGGANAGGRTPAWSASSSAGSGNRDSRGYDAPTPGGAYSAPTPGAYTAPTPGASAPTPGAWADSAPTPGVFNAPTPGGLSGRPYDAPTPAMVVRQRPRAQEHMGMVRMAGLVTTKEHPALRACFQRTKKANILECILRCRFFYLSLFKYRWTVYNAWSVGLFHTLIVAILDIYRADSISCTPCQTSRWIVISCMGLDPYAGRE